jgi:hypothetical protein
MLEAKKDGMEERVKQPPVEKEEEGGRKIRKIARNKNRS